MLALPAALSAMANYRQFILWQLVGLKKLPIDPRTGRSMPKGVDWQHDPQYLTDAQTAIITAALFGDSYGVGFLFTRNDPFFFIDIDKCLQDDNTWSPLANQIINMFPGAAVEISQSGTGLHIFGTGPELAHGCKNVSLGVELYTESRFVALTGTSASGDVGTDHTAALNAFVSAFVPVPVATNPATWTSAPCADWDGIKDDDLLIKKALSSKSAAAAFGARASFTDLWSKNITVLTDVYSPDESDDCDYDESSADMALAQHLAFWTGRDCERIYRLMFKSQLVRDKWQRDDYVKRTISRACSLQKDVYKGRVSVSVESRADELTGNPDPVVMSGFQFLGATQQIDHFKGCVYVQNLHRIFTPDGALLRADQFNATYGGFVFQLDTEASGKTTRKAWEAFTESQVVRYPKASKACFKPDKPTGEMIKHEGLVMVNTYVDVMTPRISGDVSRFLNHCKKLLPNARDREILISYMAACVQFKGIKFQWCPLIQGAEGNGKTLLTRVLIYALGERFSHMPRADEIAEKFNAWLFGKLLIGIEDIYVPEHKREIIEILKPMITGDRLACRAMNTDQYMMENLANFILNSNYKDAVRKHRGDRRFSIFFTAQQTAADILTSGMGGNYFPEIYKWLNGDGYAIVAHYLDNYKIPDEYNPVTTLHRAPDTSSTLEAIAASLGSIEQEIVEAIETDRPGFAGGWISSMALDRMLDSMHKNIARNKRREILQLLGYDWHMGLINGRVNNIISLDMGKPRLFIKSGHPDAGLTNAADIARKYQEAQIKLI